MIGVFAAVHTIRYTDTWPAPKIPREREKNQIVNHIAQSQFIIDFSECFFSD